MSISAVATSATTPALVKLANGEYTAASVNADQKDATKLGLVKEKDGNYGTTAPTPVSSSAGAQSSSTVQTTLASLTLGGE